ncbi:MAG: hypothetical protein M0Z92_14565 [Actinomycetota bacterium]|nr:hypothetical protein [Actinomycetota bacterium]
MEFSESRVIVGDLASAFSKRLGDAEIEAWHRFCLRRFDPKRAHATAKKIIQSEERFPTVAKFIEISRTITLGNEIGGAPRVIEIEDGVFRPLAEELAEMRETCTIRQPDMTEEDRARNLFRLGELLAEHFGRPRLAPLPFAKTVPDDLWTDEDPF